MKEKHPKMDRHKVSDEEWELDLITAKFRCTRNGIREAKKAVGVSRQKIYRYLRESLKAQRN